MRNILDDIGNFIFVEDEPQKADAIMVVGGSYPELAEIAADLWKQKYAPYIFIGGGVSIKTGKFAGVRSKQELYNKEYATEYDFYMDVLLKNGVAESAILGEAKSGFTRQNAFFAKQVTEENNIPIRKMLLICKAFHARRCLMFYQSAFPEAEILVIPFAGFDITKDNWYKTEYGVKRTLGEVARCGNQFDFSDIDNFGYRAEAKG